MTHAYFLPPVPHSLAIAAYALLGLCVGSFLNVVIYRLPRILHDQWAGETPSLGLAQPASHCVHCSHPIRWFENIPVVGFIWLRGRCNHCGAKISWQYPLIELATCAVFIYCAWRWGGDDYLHSSIFLYAGLLTTLLCAAAIDWNTTYLPDDLTLPLLWSGLIASAQGWLMHVNIYSSLWGAVTGYLSLWSVYWAFRILTRKEGMGYGDFKLFAAIGAWLGWQALTPIALIACASGIVLALGWRATHKARITEQVALAIPFGPALALGAACSLVFDLRF